MTIPLNFLKLNALPSTFVPNTAYLIAKAGTSFFDLYISSTDGSAVKHIANMDDMLGNTVLYADAPPTLPNKSPLWWNTATGVLFIQYVNGASQSWVEAISSVAIPEFAGTGTAITMSRSDHTHSSILLADAEW